MNLSVKNVPEEIVRRLKERAASNHRSLQGELMSILDEAARVRPHLTAADILARVRAMGIATPNESAAMVRADRDDR